VVPCGKTLRVFLPPIRDGEIVFPYTDAHSHKYDYLGYEQYLQIFKKCITAVLNIFMILILKKSIGIVLYFGSYFIGVFNCYVTSKNKCIVLIVFILYCETLSLLLRRDMGAFMGRVEG